MPVAGEIRATGPDSVKTGESLFRIRPAEPLREVPKLIRGERALTWYTERIRVLRRYLSEAVSPELQLGLGPVMADGGAPQHGLEDVLGRTAYEELVAAIAHV